MAKLQPRAAAAAIVLIAACSGGASSDEAAAGPREAASTPQVVDLAPYFGDLAGTFVLLDGRTGRTVVHDAERARARFVPASTFKIPNTLIALETGVADGLDFALVRDEAVAPAQPWWPDGWRRDHTLRTALPASVVWFYQEIARRVGADRMQAMLDAFDYGNRDISGGIDTFWLTGGLRISAEEQVDFLRRFHAGELAASEAATRAVRELLVLEETPEYRLSGKTGWAGFGGLSSEQLGWLVGYVERGEDDVHFFAMNIDMRGAEDAAARAAITRDVLRAMGLIDE